MAVRNLIIAVIVLLGTISSATAQEIAKNDRRNTFELYLPVCHFFDGTPTNWFVLIPWSETVVHHSPGGPYFTFKEKYVFPFTFGLQFTHRIDNTWGYKVGFMCYYMWYAQTRNSKPGDVLRIQSGLLSGGVLYKLISSDNTAVDALGEVNFRFGKESCHVSFPRWFESRGETHILADMGLSLGLRAQTELFWHLVLTGGIKYTRYVYRNANGKPPQFPDDKGSSQNTLTLRLGLGYQF